MARNCYYTGGAGLATQKETYTPTVAGLHNFTITCGDWSVTYTATVATAANVVDGLYALLTSTGCPTVLQHGYDVNWSKPTTTSLRATASQSGELFDFTLSASGGSSWSTVVDQAPSGPGHIDLADNWDTGVAPVNGDSIYILRGSWNIKYGLAAFSGMTFPLGVFEFLGSIGLPYSHATNLYSYDGYGLPRYLKAGFTTLRVGLANGLTPTYQVIRIDGESVASTVWCAGASSAAESGSAGFQYLGNNASTVLNVKRASVDIAMVRGEAATIGTLNVGATNYRDADSLVNVGWGATLTTLNALGGRTVLHMNPTTVTANGGRVFSGDGCTKFGAEGAVVQSVGVDV